MYLFLKFQISNKVLQKSVFELKNKEFFLNTNSKNILNGISNK